MHPCATDHPALPALFASAVLDHPVLWAVLRGRHGGKALVDNVQSPSQCVLRTDTVLQRLEFCDCDPRSSVLVNLRQGRSDGFAIRPIDRPLLERCEWRSDIEFYCGSVDNFLANGMGLCLMRGNDIVCHLGIGLADNER